MKARDEIREETYAAARFVGYALFALGALMAALATIAPFLDKHVDLPWYLSVIFIVLSIPLMFPRSAMGHKLMSLADTLIDRFLPGKA